MPGAEKLQVKILLAGDRRRHARRRLIINDEHIIDECLSCGDRAYNCLVGDQAKRAMDLLGRAMAKIQDVEKRDARAG